MLQMFKINVEIESETIVEEPKVERRSFLRQINGAC